MSNTMKSAIFLLLTFAISWSVAIGAYFAGLAEGPMAVPALVGMMAGPAISALVCVFAFEKGRRKEALGLHFRINWWWLAAWLVPLALAAASVVVTILLSERTYVDISEAIRQMAASRGQDVSEMPPLLMNTFVIVALSATLGAAINTPILTFTEELGWRGYLYDLWRPAGFWRDSLGAGMIWGVWHAPASYLFGLNYPENPVLGIGLFTVYCILLSPIITLVRERAGSVWAAGLFHGAFNAVGGLTLVALSNPSFPWNGIVGIGGFVVMALGVVVVALLQPQRAPPRQA